MVAFVVDEANNASVWWVSFFESVRCTWGRSVGKFPASDGWKMGEQIPLRRPRYPLLIPDVDSVAKDLGFASFFPPRAKKRWDSDDGHSHGQNCHSISLGFFVSMKCLINGDELWMDRTRYDESDNWKYLCTCYWWMYRMIGRLIDTLSRVGL